jgi:O-antigen/teichoic acid export membrane protein
MGLAVEMPNKPWRQLAFVLCDAALALAPNGLLFIVISRVAGPALLGSYALALAWLTLFQSLSSFGIPEFIMREVGVYGRTAAVYVVHAMVIGLGSSLVGIGLMVGGSRLTGYSPEIREAIAIASLSLVPAFLNAACRSVFLALREMHMTVLVTFVEAAIMISVSSALVLSGHGTPALMVTLVAAKGAAAILGLALLHFRVFALRQRWNGRLLKRIAGAVVAFGIGNMLGMLSMRVNTILVSLWVDIAEVGRFAAATKILDIGLMVPSLFVQLLLTRMAHSFNAQNERDPNRFGAWYQVLFSVVLPLCIGCWVFAGAILRALLGPGFETASWVLRILMIYLLIESIDAVNSTILRAAHRQRDDARLLAFNPLGNIVLSVALLPLLGTVGAAIGRAVAVAISALLRSRLIARELGAVNWLRPVLKPALISAAVAGLCSLLAADRPIWLLVLYATATGALLVLSSSFSFSAIKDMMTLPPLPGGRRRGDATDEKPAVPAPSR